MAEYRTLAAGQVARIHVHDVQTGVDDVVHESTEVLYEAPNWSPDGGALLVNGNGVLWKLDLAPGSQPAVVDHPDLPEINNDHVLDPDGVHIYMSGVDGHIYKAPRAGGHHERITTKDGDGHYLHGIHPDGSLLAYVQMQGMVGPGRLGILGASGGDAPMVLETGTGHIDGPEWSPDGEWIYFNTELWASEPGHAQLARLPHGGGQVERLHTSSTVDWFPHLSPDGYWAVYLEFPPGTQGHPADRDVALVVVRCQDWDTPVARLPLQGGQGTINVNSWAPNSQRFAYISYPTPG